jgi:phytanoyl-CoA hydroxylase
MAKNHLDENMIEEFRNDGFIFIPNILSIELVEQLRARYEPLFSGVFDTVACLH